MSRIIRINNKPSYNINPSDWQILKGASAIGYSNASETYLKAIYSTTITNGFWARLCSLNSYDFSAISNIEIDIDVFNTKVGSFYHGSLTAKLIIHSIPSNVVSGTIYYKDILTYTQNSFVGIKNYPVSYTGNFYITFQVYTPSSGSYYSTMEMLLKSIKLT